MPQELKRPHAGGGWSIDLLFHKPLFTPHIATVLHIWAAIEMRLADLVSDMALLGSQIPVSTYFSTYRFDLRLAKIASAANKTLGLELNAKLPELFQRLTVCHRERNQIAHTRWAEDGAFPDGIIMLPHAEEFFAGKKSVWLFSINDFVEIEQRLAAAEVDVRTLAHSVLELAAGP